MSRDGLVVGAAAAVAAMCVAQLRAPTPSDPRWQTALTHTQALLGSDPRPVGSDAHDEARRRLAGAFEALGAEVTEPAAMSCGAWGRCARVVNLLARMGPSAGPAVAVMAHYDSVPASPGAADDGVGVAIALEIARRYAEHPGGQALLLVMTDAEELGLLGAKELVDDHVLPELSVVINLEARGTDGPCLLFETAGPSGPIVARFAQTATHPLTSSLFDAIYQVLPNDTDLSVVRALGVPGLNLSFIGHPLKYHSPEDRADQLSLASAAHQGEIAAALVDSLLRDPLEGEAEIVWFDVLGLGVVRVPRWLVLPAGILALLGVAARARGAGVTAKELSIGAGLALLVVLVASAVGLGIGLAVHSGTGAPWRAWPNLVALSLIAPGIAVGFGLPRLGPGGLGPSFGAWLVGAAAAIALAAALPGAAHLFLLPAVLTGIPVSRSAAPWWDRIAAIAPLVVWCPVTAMLYVALGSPGAAVTLGAAVAATWLGFALREGPAGRVVAWCAAVVGAAATAAALAAPRHDVSWPAPTNLVLEQAPDKGVQIRAEGEPMPLPALPAGLELRPPKAEVIERGADGTLVLHLTSDRSAPTLGLQWETPDVAVSVDGVAAEVVPRDGRWGIWVHGVGPEGVTIALTPRGTPIRGDLFAVDETTGLPPSITHSAASSPFDLGDRTRVFQIVGPPDRRVQGEP